MDWSLLGTNWVQFWIRHQTSVPNGGLSRVAFMQRIHRFAPGYSSWGTSCWLRKHPFSFNASENLASCYYSSFNFQWGFGILITKMQVSLQEDQRKPSFYDVSLVDGYNLPISVATKPYNSSCTIGSCKESINNACPKELQVWYCLYRTTDR